MLVGTQSGNAAMVADTLRAALTRDGVAVELAPENGVGPELIAQHEWMLVCCSTHGDGDVPDNLVPLVGAVRSQDADFSRLRYGVVALGDRTYSGTFCYGGKLIDEMLAERGAQRLGDRLEIDASAQPFADEVALEWLPGWLESARSAAVK